MGLRPHVIMTVTEISVQVAYYMVYLHHRPISEPLEKSAERVRKLLPQDWKEVLEACQKPKVVGVYNSRGVPGAAVTAAMYLSPKSQEALAHLF